MRGVRAQTSMTVRESTASFRKMQTNLTLSTGTAPGERNREAASAHPKKGAAMTIGKFCNRNVVCATRDTTVVEAATLMQHHHVGDLIVVDRADGGRTADGRRSASLPTAASSGRCWRPASTRKRSSWVIFWQGGW